MAKAELIICHEDKIYHPDTLEGVRWTSERKGSPSKLTFKVLKPEYTSMLDIHEGDQVTFKWNHNIVFYGYIFSIRYDESDVISITAYDQLRYLTNEETYVYKNKTASDVIKMIANDFGLKCGNIAKTPYTIKERIEDGQTLFDIINNALELTVRHTGRLYVLYDQFGWLMLVDAEDMITGVVITAGTAEGYTYNTSIDEQTYNQIKLYFDNKATGKRDVYIEKDSSNIKKWGMLQFYEKLDEGEDGKTKAQKLLSLYNAPTRTLKLNGVFGDLSVRAGSSVVIKMKVGNKHLCHNFFVESCTHEFLLDEHKMDLSVRGGGLDG